MKPFPSHRTLLAWGAALLVLLGVFLLYTRPDFLLTLADQLWACF
jgi:type II secretory pathway component PulM